MNNKSKLKEKPEWKIQLEKEKQLKKIKKITAATIKSKLKTEQKSILSAFSNKNIVH